MLLGWTARRGELPEYIICEKGSLHLWMNWTSMVSILANRFHSSAWCRKFDPLAARKTDVAAHGGSARPSAGKRHDRPYGSDAGFLRAVVIGGAETASAVEARRDLEIIFPP